MGGMERSYRPGWRRTEWLLAGVLIVWVLAYVWVRWG